MGYDFIGKQGSFMVNIHGWDKILHLANENGWEPMGTEPPGDWDENKEGEWEGRYHTNDWQRVTTEDASNMADALEKGLVLLPGKERSEVDPFYMPFIWYARQGGFSIG